MVVYTSFDPTAMTLICGQIHVDLRATCHSVTCCFALDPMFFVLHVAIFLGWLLIAEDCAGFFSSACHVFPVGDGGNGARICREPRQGPHAWRVVVQAIAANVANCVCRCARLGIMFVVSVQVEAAFSSACRGLTMAEQPLVQAPPLAEPAEEAAPLDEPAGTDDGSSSSDSESESAIKRRLERSNRKMMCLRVEKVRTMVHNGITKQSELKSKCQQLTS